jgi:hypothetical protein
MIEQPCLTSRVQTIVPQEKEEMGQPKRGGQPILMCLLISYCRKYTAPLLTYSVPPKEDMRPPGLTTTISQTVSAVKQWVKFHHEDALGPVQNMGNSTKTNSFSNQ